MNLLRKSVVLKLWLLMVALVLLILYFTGVIQTAKLKQLYYDQKCINRHGRWPGVIIPTGWK